MRLDHLNFRRQNTPGCQSDLPHCTTPQWSHFHSVYPSRDRGPSLPPTYPTRPPLLRGRRWTTGTRKQWHQINPGDQTCAHWADGKGTACIALHCSALHMYGRQPTAPQPSPPALLIPQHFGRHSGVAVRAICLRARARSTACPEEGTDHVEWTTTRQTVAQDSEVNYRPRPRREKRRPTPPRSLSKVGKQLPQMFPSASLSANSLPLAFALRCVALRRAGTVGGIDDRQVTDGRPERLTTLACAAVLIDLAMLSDGLASGLLDLPTLPVFLPVGLPVLTAMDDIVCCAGRRTDGAGNKVGLFLSLPDFTQRRLLWQS
ncbi:hypothetical protein HDK90DRAFT_230643 [Phyllosticta capitalensis]|uniref:Uncharacterized protein n=1 Tax=Phyllosticta capitalensis TaxID=121624 RepID=A0ABR1YUW8_9PEZI